MVKPLRFCDIMVGETFDFINDNKVGYNSFFYRCTKISTRCYTYQHNEHTIKCQVGSVRVNIHHVGE